MNFWEARQAALKGKKVRKVGARTEFGASAFQAHTTWNTLDIDAEWEIVDGPKNLTYYINVYKNTLGSARHSLEELDRQDLYTQNSHQSRLEIVIDKNGKLISAKNV